MIYGRRFSRRRIVHVLHTDLAHGALGMGLLLVLVVERMPFWLVLALPLVTYVGLRLLVAPNQTSEGGVQRTPVQTDRATYELYVERLQEIVTLYARFDDARVRELVQCIAGRIDLILQAITEDDAYRASPALLGLLDPTRDLLASYARVVERQLGTGEGRERVLANLETLDTAYASFWQRLNRSALVRLDAINDTIDFFLEEPEAASRRGGQA